MQFDETDTAVHLERGKYTFVCTAAGQVYCLRGGEPWVEFGTIPGAKALISLVHAAAERDRLVEALEFYADPETYHGVTMLCDPPGGGWAEDFGDSHNHPRYRRAMPGSKAREVLRGLLWWVSDKEWW
jgi:hypothetical protein